MANDDNTITVTFSTWEFKKFPVKLQKLAISTTRGWFKGTFLPTEKKVTE